VKAHQFKCTQLTLNLKLMYPTLDPLFGVVRSVIFKKI
jgi:hypothetical protein